MIKLGDKVKDKVSGLIGTAVSKTEYLNGCIQYAVMPKVKKGGIEMPSWNIDQTQLESLEKPIKVKKSRTGGATHRSYGMFSKVRR